MKTLCRAPENDLCLSSRKATSEKPVSQISLPLFHEETHPCVVAKSSEAWREVFSDVEGSRREGEKEVFMEQKHIASIFFKLLSL